MVGKVLAFVKKHASAKCLPSPPTSLPPSSQLLASILRLTLPTPTHHTYALQAQQQHRARHRPRKQKSQFAITTLQSSATSSTLTILIPLPSLPSDLPTPTHSPTPPYTKTMGVKRPGPLAGSGGKHDFKKRKGRVEAGGEVTKGGVGVGEDELS